MNYEDEEYIRVYVRDTATTKKIGWEGRTVLWHILRIVPKSGVLELEDGDDLVEVVAALCDLPEGITKVGLERLASRGVTVRHGSSLEVVRFVEAQNAKRSDRLRAQDYRDRQKLEENVKRAILAEKEASASRSVTQRHDSSPLPSPLPPLASPPLPLPLPPSPPPEDEKVPITNTKIPCPPDLRLAAGQRSTLEGSFIPGWAIDQLTTKFAARFTASETDLRPLEAWRKCLSMAICSDWNDPNRRPQKPADEHARSEAIREAEAREAAWQAHQRRKLDELNAAALRSQAEGVVPRLDLETIAGIG